jgi:hypothetical protein
MFTPIDTPVTLVFAKKIYKTYMLHVGALDERLAAAYVPYVSDECKSHDLYLRETYYGRNRLTTSHYLLGGA